MTKLLVVSHKLQTLVIGSQSIQPPIGNMSGQVGIGSQVPKVDRKYEGMQIQACVVGADWKKAVSSHLHVYPVVVSIM
jgi:hypothetical protein